MFSKYVALCLTTKIFKNILPFVIMYGECLLSCMPYLQKLILKTKTSKGQRVTVSVFAGGLIVAIDD